MKLSLNCTRMDWGVDHKCLLFKLAKGQLEGKFKKGMGIHLLNSSLKCQANGIVNIPLNPSKKDTLINKKKK